MKNDNDTRPNRNKEDLKGAVQKPALSKEELKSVCNLLLSEVSLTVEPRPPVLKFDTLVSNITKETPRRKAQSW